MFSDLSESARRELARRYLDTAEAWLRRVIDYQLSNAFGSDYFFNFLATGTPVIPTRIREQVDARLAEQPHRFPRPVDATHLGDAIKIILHPELYRSYFREVLAQAYPEGDAEARTFLTRLESHRNKFAHGGTCSVRDLEQCVCYSNDLIDSLKTFFRIKNMGRLFNVPTLTRLVDNKGNDFRFNGPAENGLHHLDVRSRETGLLCPNETLILEAEVDETFEGYTINWMSFNGDKGRGARWELPIELKHVGDQLIIRCEIVSAEQWHKLHGGCDDRLDIRYRVLPPP